MKKYSGLLLIVFLYAFAQGFSQDLKTGAGIGIYPTGTETGLGYRSSRTNRWVIDVRITKANAFTEPRGGTLINEASWIYRIAYHERVRFHAGVGARADWNSIKHNCIALAW